MGTMSKSPIRFVFFGGEPLGVPILEQLSQASLVPDLIVCNPDRPSGRGKQLMPPPVKVWALKHNIPIWQPEHFHDMTKVRAQLAAYDLFIVVAYNHILPSWLIELPKHTTLNVHPSLLPKYRGPSPIRSAILADDPEVGVSIIKLDEYMDHGPLIAQEPLSLTTTAWPVDGRILDQELATLSGKLLANTIPAWVAGDITPQPQEHSHATYTKKFTKADGELTLDPFALPTGDSAYKLLLKVRALTGFPGTFFMYGGKRVKVTAATIENDTFVIERVIPEGKSEQLFSEYLRGYINNSTK